MDHTEFMQRIRPNLRPIGIDTCPICGKEKQTINKLLNSKTPPRCIPCWQVFEEDYEQPPVPVKKVVVAQETLTDLVTKVSELAGRVEELERELFARRKRR